MDKYLKTISVNRPLVFLCGVAIPDKKEQEKRDRRIILKDRIAELTQIKDKNQNIQYQVMPIIVDYIFKKKLTNGVSLSLLEEIVSAISYKTYIFLDSMATSYELGLFTNSKSYNDVKVLVGKGYENRANCSVGEYIRRAHKNFIEYTVEYNEKGHLFFYNNVVPKEIEDAINIDINDIKAKEKNVTIKFTNDMSPNLEFGDVYLVDDKDIITFQMNIKTMFYIVDAITRKNKGFKINKKIIHEVIREIKNNLFLNYLSNSIDKIKYYHMIKKPEIKLLIMNYDTEIIVKHILQVIISMRKNNRNGKYFTDISASEYYEFENIKLENINYQLMIEEFFELNNKDKKVINEYQKHQELYCKSFLLRMNKKNKKIVTYADNQRGTNLRVLHEKISRKLQQIYIFSNISYAYKENSSILSCIKKHNKSSYFFKLDISKFFDSINKKELKRKVLKSVINSHKESLKIYSVTERKINSCLSNILNVCFYNCKVPIGFVTSPVLSDIYMNDVDRMIEKTKIKVTRYADDFLISSDSAIEKTKIKKMIKKIEKELKELNLEFNKSKMLEKEFKFVGDSLKFLGVNIVFNGKDIENRFTISKKYLIQTSKMMKKAMNLGDYYLFDKCIGRINHIKNVSYESYKKLMNIYNSHSNGVIFEKPPEKIFNFQKV